jgi:hypothetical protein
MAPVWRQRELLAESSTNGDVVTASPRREHKVQPCENDCLQEQAMTLFRSAKTTATSRPVAGVTIPDSNLAREVTELVRDTE